MAVIFSLFRIAIPYITGYGDTIETELSKQLGMPVEIDDVDADIQWLTPRLNLLGVRIYDKTDHRLIFSCKEINLGLGWLQSFRKMKPELGFVSVSGLDLQVERTADGGLVVQGYHIRRNEASEGGIPKEIYDVFASSSIYIRNSTIRWTDKLHNSQSLLLTSVGLSLLNAAPHHQLAVIMDLPQPYGNYLQFILDFEGALDKPFAWKGKLYATANDVHLARWFDDYWQVLGFVGGGNLDASVWLEWEQKTISKIDARLNGDQMALHYLDDSVRSWKLDHLDGLLRWVKNANGWTVDVRQLNMKRGEDLWPEPAAISIQLDEAKNYVDTQATFIRLEDLAYLGGLVTSFIPLQDFNWNDMFDSYRPRGDLYDVSLHVPLDRPNDATINARFNNLGYETTTSLPAAIGLDGSLRYDGSSTLLDLDSRKVKLHYPALFRNDLVLEKLAGEIRFRRDGDAWRLGSDELQLATPHLSTRSRLDLLIPDVGQPFLDIVSEYSRGDASQKSLYFPTAVMPESAVNWLDNAIVRADITRGGFLFYGALDDYPFNGGEGVMQAMFDVEHATLQYLADWPPLENMQARVNFKNRSLNIEDGRGTILGADFYNTRLAIQDLGSAHLDIKGDVKSPLPELIKFVGQSPLKKVFGEYFLGMQTSGPTELNLDIQVPLSEHGQTDVKGLLSFNGDEVFLPHEGYHFADLKGELSFTETEIQADALQASIDGHAISVAINSMEDDAVDEQPSKFIRISADGKMPVKHLLRPLPALVDYADGSADWHINVDIPTDHSERILSVFAQSNLLGVSTKLPGCYGKTPDQPAVFVVGMDLLKDSGLDLRVKSEQLYDVVAERRQQKWLVNVTSRDLVGNARFMEDLSRDQPMDLRVDYVNVQALLGGEDKPSNADVAPGDIPPLHVQIRKLDWGDYKFSDINLETERTSNGMLIKHFEVHAPTVNMIGKGSWLTNWRYDNATSLDFTVDTSNLGETLSQFKITDSIRKTDGKVTVNWSWPARPYQFDWNIVKGNARLQLEDGQLSDIEVGAGRLIGILNFETLLSLDFGNQVSKGFAFDSLEGDLRFDAGNAFTRELTIESKVAEITLDGRIGLSNEDYDQVITVIPGVGSTLTVIGAVAGGPVTAAAVHLFQKLFGINKIAEYKYSVKGSWKQPEVKLLSAPKEKEKARSGQAEDENN